MKTLNRIFWIYLFLLMINRIGNISPKQILFIHFFRCVYIDPVTQRVETVGHKEEYLFYRDNEEGEMNDNIEEKWEEYQDYINDIIINVRKGMKNLQDAVQNLDQAIVG